MRISPRLIFIASSASLIDWLPTCPSFLISRVLSTVRIWSRSAIDVTARPDGLPSAMRTWAGERGKRTADVIGAMIVVPKCSLDVSF